MIQLDFDEHMYLIVWIERNLISLNLNTTQALKVQVDHKFKGLFLKRPLNFGKGLFHQQAQGTIILMVFDLQGKGKVAANVVFVSRKICVW